MNWERVKSNWKAFAASAQQQWKTLTEKDLEAIGGDRERPMIFLQDFNGYDKSRAEFEVEMWRKGLDEVATLVAGNNGAENLDAPVRDRH